MKDDELLERIVQDPRVMVGKPVIRGTRLTVDFILNLLAHGSTEKDVLDEYQGLSKEDQSGCNRACLGPWKGGFTTESATLIEQRSHLDNPAFLFP